MSPEELRDTVIARLPDAPLVVALGGGADSAVAAWACAGNPPVRAVFVHHDLKGSEALLSSAKDAADTVAIGLTVLSAPVTEGGNLESRARDARWRAIRDQLVPDEIVVTGHSQDDVAETVLMNLLRGAGSRGLASMSVPRADVTRPLSGFTRSDLRAIAEELGLPYVDDPANDDPGHLRNRIRANLIPLLERDYQSGVRTTLARSASLLSIDDAELEADAMRVPVLEDGGALLVPRPVLNTAPPPVAARAVRRVLRTLHPPYAGKAADVDAVMSVAAGARRSATLGSGVTVSVEGPYVAMWIEEPVVPGPVSLSVPGTAPFGAEVISALRIASEGPISLSAVLVDPSVFETGVIVRAAAIGERIDIAGGTKLVRDALGEVGVPKRKRPAWPVLSNDAKIAAIVGGRVAPWARPTGAGAVSITQEHA